MAEKAALVQDRSDRFLSVFGNNAQLDSALPYIKDLVSRRALRINNLLLSIFLRGSGSHQRDESIRIDRASTERSAASGGMRKPEV
jgi:hypothetical protein